MLTSLILFAIVATLSPGGATTLATASGAQFGYLKSLPLILGIAAALAVLVAVSGAGLSSVLARFPMLSLAMKLAGSGYLLWLAAKIARSGGAGAGRNEIARPVGFLGGGLLLAVNPKAWAMAFGVGASFSTLMPDPVQQAGLMATVFGAAAVLSLSIWCVGGAILARTLRTQRQWRVLNITLAALLALSIVQIWL